MLDYDKFHSILFLTLYVISSLFQPTAVSMNFFFNYYECMLNDCSFLSFLVLLIINRDFIFFLF